MVQITTLLTHEDRERLAIESNFKSFENTITEIVNTGKYKKVVYHSACQVLVGIINHALNELKIVQKTNEELRKNDNQQVRITLAEKRLKQLDLSEKQQEKETNDFINWYANYLKDGLFECTEKKLEEIEKIISQEIQIKLCDYDQYEEFEKYLCSNFQMSISEYFSKCAVDEINKFRDLKLKDYIRSDFEDIYDSAIQRLKKYNSVLIDASKDGTFKIQLEETSKEELSLKSRNLYKRVEELKQEFIQENAKLQDCKEKAKGNLKDQKIYKQAEEEIYSDIRYSYAQKVNALGKKPEIKRVEYKETRSRKKTGWNAFVGFFTGDRYEDYTVTCYRDDDSAQRNWLRDKRNLDDTYQRRLDASKRKIDRCVDAITDLEAVISRSTQDEKKLMERVLQLKKTVKSEQEIYNTIETQFRKEYCEVLRQRLIESMHESFFESDNCANLYLQNYISDMYAKNLSSLKSCDQNIYHQSIAIQKKQLKDAISQTKEELEKKYNNVNEEIKQLEEIKINVKTLSLK